MFGFGFLFNLLISALITFIDLCFVEMPKKLSSNILRNYLIEYNAL